MPVSWRLLGYAYWTKGFYRSKKPVSSPLPSSPGVAARPGSPRLVNDLNGFLLRWTRELAWWGELPDSGRRPDHDHRHLSGLCSGVIYTLRAAKVEAVRGCPELYWVHLWVRVLICGASRLLAAITTPTSGAIKFNNMPGEHKLNANPSAAQSFTLPRLRLGNSSR